MSCVKEKDFFLNHINQSTASLKTNKKFKQKFYDSDWKKKNHTALNKEKRCKKGSDYRLRIYIPGFS